MKPMSGPLVAGLLMAAMVSVSPAVAQYRSGGGDEGGYDRNYDPRYNRGEYEHIPGRGRNPGYAPAPRRDGYGPGPRNDRYAPGARGDGYGRGPNPRQDPMWGMSIEDQKRAIKNQREAQKKAIKRGYVIP